VAPLVVTKSTPAPSSILPKSSNKLSKKRRVRKNLPQIHQNKNRIMAHGENELKAQAGAVLLRVEAERSRSPSSRPLLDRHSAVGLLGPRQAGKTTLALEIARQRSGQFLVLGSA